MSFTVTHSLTFSFFSHNRTQPLPHSLNSARIFLECQSLHARSPYPIQASRRSLTIPQGSDDFVDNPRTWSGRIAPEYVGGDHVDEDDDDDDDDDEDRSLDLFVRFVQNVFKKISKRARKAVRSVLPLSISTKLVGFSVNGVLMLAFLWILKAFLEVVCTLGSIVFVSILLIRGIWSGVTYLQESRNYKNSELDDDHQAWSAARPAT